MKILVFLALLGIHSVGAVTHSLKYFYTASSNVPNFPEFVAVGLVDDLQIDHYDSNTKVFVPKQDWVKEAKTDDPNNWERHTANFKSLQQTFKANIEIARQRFNESRGVHVVQFMYGCEWDDETQEINGFRQHGYDGEDFLAFDMKNLIWVAPKQQAEITKRKWDNDKADIAYIKSYHTQICVDWLKKYVNYGRSSLMRTVLPSVSVHKKTPSTLSCHATGFYPDRAMMFWRKDGEEVHDGVELGEILPNHDGSFQRRVDLLSVPAGEHGKYECVFQLSGVKDDIITKLEDGGFPLGAVIGGVVGLLLLVACIVGVVIWKKNNHGFKRAGTSDTSGSSDEVTAPALGGNN